MIGDILSGFKAYFQAFSMIGRYQLWPYLLVTGCISILIFSFLFFGIYSSYGTFGSWLSDFYPWETGKEIAEKSSGILAIITMSLGSFMLFKYLLLILVSPFMAPLSQKVERHLTSNVVVSSKFLSLDTAKELWRGIRISVRNLWRELFLTLFLIILSFFPGLAIVTTPLIFCVQAYYAGFGNMDYTMERYLSIEDSVHFVRSNRGVALGNGLVFILILSIPVLGVFFAPTLATISATTEVIRKGIARSV